jgi:hypothetical protein
LSGICELSVYPDLNLIISLTIKPNKFYTHPVL